MTDISNLKASKEEKYYYCVMHALVNTNTIILNVFILLFLKDLLNIKLKSQETKKM
jgi:hypothetical protein